MILLPDLESETVKTFEAAVTELFPDATVSLREQTIMGPPYVIIYIPDHPFVDMIFHVHVGQGLQGVDKDALRVVDL